MFQKPPASSTARGFRNLLRSHRVGGSLQPPRRIAMHTIIGGGRECITPWAGAIEPLTIVVEPDEAGRSTVVHEESFMELCLHVAVELEAAVRSEAVVIFAHH